MRRAWGKELREQDQEEDKTTGTKHILTYAVPRTLSKGHISCLIVVHVI